MYLWLSIDVCSSLTHAILTLAKQKMTKQNEEAGLNPLLKQDAHHWKLPCNCTPLSIRCSFLTHFPTSISFMAERGAVQNPLQVSGVRKRVKMSNVDSEVKHKPTLLGPGMSLPKDPANTPLEQQWHPSASKSASTHSQSGRTRMEQAHAPGT